MISASWFDRWSFYYQGKDYTEDLEPLQSTKIMRRQSHMNSIEKMKPKKKPSLHKINFEDP